MHNTRTSQCLRSLTALLGTVIFLAGCESIASKFKREQLPNLGAPIQINVRLELDSSLTEARAQYTDTCGHFVPVIIGSVLEDTLVQAALQTFKTVQYGGSGPANVKPDATIRIRLLKPVLNIRWDALYDRAPAELTLDAFAEFRDAAGNVVAEQPIQSVRKERVRIEAVQKNCAFVLDPFVNDAAMVFSTKFAKEARALLAPDAAASAQSAPQPAEPVKAVAPTPDAVSPDDVDRVPPANGLQRSQVFLVSVGISSYRDQPVPSRKYAASDAELVSAYFQALGGVPASNVRMLRDGKALRPDIEDTLLDWLPSRVAPESLVIIYFSGQAKVAASGDVFLVPYEGGASTARLYPLKDLQAALSRLKARHIVMIFDGSVSRLADAPGKSKDPQWEAGPTQVVRLIGTSGVQNGLEPEKLRHGLFTYYLLRGLRGEADENLNGEVTLGELAAFLDRAVPAAAKSDFKQEQRPQVLPALQAGSRSTGVMLTKTASSR